MITEKDKENIRLSWDYIIQDSLNNMLKFYSTLFEIAPEVRIHFPDDMSKLTEKLSYTINIAVSNLDRFDALKPTLEDLGRTHTKLGIEPIHYTYVKRSLLHTIQDVMGPFYKEEIGNSWDKVLTVISSVMINAPAKRTNQFGSLLKKLFGG